MAPSRANSRLQNFEDDPLTAEASPVHPPDGAIDSKSPKSGNEVSKESDRKDLHMEESGLSGALNGATLVEVDQKNSDSEEEDSAEEDEPPRPSNGGYWRQGAASR